MPKKNQTITTSGFSATSIGPCLRQVAEESAQDEGRGVRRIADMIESTEEGRRLVYEYCQIAGETSDEGELLHLCACLVAEAMRAGQLLKVAAVR